MSLGLDLDEAYQNTSPIHSLFSDIAQQGAAVGTNPTPFPTFATNLAVMPDPQQHPPPSIKDDDASPEPVVQESDHGGMENPAQKIMTGVEAPSLKYVKPQPYHRSSFRPYKETFANDDQDKPDHGTPTKTSSAGKRTSNDFLKSILFSLMILLSISAHAFIVFVFEHYVTSTGNFTMKQEAGIRLLYPLLLLLIIWLVKNYK